MKDQRSICLFVHFNKTQQVSDYVFTYLESISALEFEIIFISNSPVLATFKSKLLGIPKCTVFERENKGGDFGGWSWALEHDLIPSDAEFLLLTNDSVFGPFFPLESIFEKMNSRPGIDFWGLTDNYQGGWHIQSYFFFTSKKVFSSNAFKKLFKQNFTALSKLEIIKSGEIQLTKSLSEAGFKGDVYIPYHLVNPGFEEWDAKNPTHFFADLLVENFDFPFLKKELVLQNPENIQGIDKVFQIIESRTNYPISNIEHSISEFLSTHDTSTNFTDKISVLCHLYYPGSVYYFLTRLFSLKSPQTHFVFNLSASLFHNVFFCDMLTKYFPGAIILFTPNQGRDIGGKMAAIDVLLKSGIKTDFSLIIHDKLSPHTVTGIEWRNRLLRIINPAEISKIFKKFHQMEDAGVITSQELIKNEYDPDREKFTCTSSEHIFRYMEKYTLTVSDYKFAAGTIFWIRTSILEKFFSIFSPLSVRKEFEKGNTLDFDRGTNIHAWERLFSFIAQSQGYRTLGI